MSLSDYLLVLESRARLAFAILDDAASDDEVQLFRDDLGLEVGEHAHDTAHDYLHGGYAFTTAPGSATVAVLAVGGPEIHLARHGDGYVLTGYAPGHADAVRSSETITAWGRLRDTDDDA